MRTKNDNNNKGFTLIELLIVVAIIGILSMIAIPQYNNYVQRTRVAGGAAVIASWQTAVEQCILDRGTLTGCSPATVAMIPGNVASTASSKPNYIWSLSTANGVITATTTGKNSSGTRMGLTYTPSTSSGYVEWQLTGTGCKSTTPGRGIDCNFN